MHDFQTTRFEAGGKPAELLGACVVGGVALFFARQDGLEGVVLAHPAAAVGAAFRRGRALALEYRTWPRAAAGSPPPAVVERLAAYVLAHEAETVGRLRAPLPTARVLSSGEDRGRAVFRVALPGGTGAATVRLARRGELPLALLDWSAEVVAEGRLVAADLAEIQRFVLVAVGARMLRVDLGCGAAPAPARHVHVALDGDAPLDGLSGAGGAVVLSIHVPSQCDNRCVFCAPANEPDAASAQSLLAALDALLARVVAALDPATRLDVTLAGRDALNAPGVEALVGRLRGTARVARVTAVTPGTRLRDPAFAARLAAAGLDAVTLTVLGPDAPTHDAVAGRPGAHADLCAAIDGLRQAGLAFDLNTVIVRQNLSHLARTLAHARELGAAVRLYNYVPSPFARDEQVRECQVPPDALARVLAEERAAIEAHVLSVHDVPPAALPEWLRPRAVPTGHLHGGPP